GAVLLSPAASSAPAANPKLFAQVGKPMPNNDDFYIALSTTQGGPALSTIPAGTYDTQVDDYSTIHNFDLKNPGGTTIKSTMIGSEEHTTWTNLNLTAGSYSY